MQRRSSSRPPQLQILPCDVRPLPDQYDHGDDVAELNDLAGLIEHDPDLNVVVFDSANRGLYLAHYDLENDPGRTEALGVGHWTVGLDRRSVRLARAPVVSIGSIREHARGAGSEFVLACDPRFASCEKTLPGSSAGRPC
jgi:enoyl-CoA hydratase/carnithine racemase